MVSHQLKVIIIQRIFLLLTMPSSQACQALAFHRRHINLIRDRSLIGKHLLEINFLILWTLLILLPSLKLLSLWLWLSLSWSASWSLLSFKSPRSTTSWAKMFLALMVKEKRKRKESLGLKRYWHTAPRAYNYHFYFGLSSFLLRKRECFVKSLISVLLTLASMLKLNPLLHCLKTTFSRKILLLSSS